MKIGFSTCHAYPTEEKFIHWTKERLSHINYNRFEVCHERCSGENALGSIDDYIKYPLLSDLNDDKWYAPEQALKMRKQFMELKAEGKEIAFWSHELAAPETILHKYPELATEKGDLNLSHPLLTEWLQSKYNEFFKVIPEIDLIVLVMTEVNFAVAHRFDNQWSQSDCIYWLIETIYNVCRKNGKKLIVRPFSAIVEDYNATQQALKRLPDDIEIMVKSDPFDWNPFLDLNPVLLQYPPERVTVEFDLGSEYFGRGLFPVIYPDYLKKRLDYIKSIGIKSVIGRVDRKGVSALDREGRINVDYFFNYATDSISNSNQFLTENVQKYYKTSNPAKLAELFIEAFEVTKKTLYIDGQLLWHRLYGDIANAQQTLIFEILRPEQSLAHGIDEWHILHQKTTMTLKQVRDEKTMAVKMAKIVYKQIIELAPDEKELHQQAARMLAVAEIYHDTVIAMQEYLLTLNDLTHRKLFDTAVENLIKTAKKTLSMSDDNMQKIGQMAEENAEKMQKLLNEEIKVYSQLPDRMQADKQNIIDIIAVAYPGEGHKIRKFTHGSKCITDDGKTCRLVTRYLQYSIRSQAGKILLKTEVKGAGILKILENGVEKSHIEWNNKDWQELNLHFSTSNDAFEIHISRNGNTAPLMSTIYILGICE